MLTQEKHMEDDVLLRSYIRVWDGTLNIPVYAHTENCKTFSFIQKRQSLDDHAKLLNYTHTHFENKVTLIYIKYMNNKLIN